MVLCLALNMWAEQDTAILLRSRESRRTEHFGRLGRRVCKVAMAGVVKWPKGAHFNSFQD